MTTKTQDFVKAGLIGTSLNADLRSSAFLVDQIYGLSVILQKTGTAEGVLKVEFSNDPDFLVENVAVSTGWIESSTTGTVGAANPLTVGIQIEPLYYRWARVFFDYTSSTGTLTALQVTTKGP